MASSVRATTVLRGHGLSKVYAPGVVALTNFDIDLRAGEIHALAGVNGAGKSTLIKLLSGVECPTAGSVEIDHNVVQLTSTAAAEAVGVGVVHQELPLFSTLTAAENVAVGLERTRLWGPARRKLIEQTYDSVAVGFPGAPAARDRLGALSLYAWQIVAIIRATVHGARVLILDEPTSSLSTKERRALHDHLQRAARTGIAILYVTHFLDDIIRETDFVTVLRDGQLVHRGPTSDLDEEALLRHMLGDDPANHVHADHSDRRSSAASALPAGEGLECHDVVVGEARVSLTVRPGSALGIYGVDDSGAPELLEAVFGVRKYSGTIRWAGLTLPSGARARIRRGLGYVTGDRTAAAVREWSTLANFALPDLGLLRLGAHDRAVKNASSQAEHVHSRLQIKATLSQLMGSLSGGNQQKILLGRWLNDRLMCLLLDEPTRGIDVGARSVVYDALNGFVGDGGVVVIRSTDPEEIVALCDRAIVMVEGFIVADLSGADLSIHRLEEAAGRRPDSERLGN